ncbi:ATP-binding protein [Streptomyces sp. NPDC001380]|uniref:ATP-binding protein n=1 Tax=Streptomyces sp. NPDC001380 TaxID=3364566 RepID=UPI0036A41D09
MTDTAPLPVLAAAAEEEARVRTGEVVAGRFLVAVGAPEGSEALPCPADRLPEPRPVARTAGGRRPAGPVGPVGPVVLGSGPGGAALLEREAEVARLRDLLSRGRSIRVTGPSGSGRSALLRAVADSCAGIAPDGVVRLSGYRRTPADLLQDLYAATHRAPGHRPDRRELPDLLAGVGALVVVDDVEFGGAALDEFLDAAPECAFLVATAPDTAAPDSGARLEESVLGGLSRDACLALLASLAGRPLDAVERAWAVDLWFESEGLPLRFVQAGALLRHRDVAADALAVTREERASLFGGGAGPRPDGDPALLDEELRQAVPLPSVAESAAPAVRIARGLSGQAREVLRLAVGLGGQCPTAPHLPALIDVGQGESALRELVDCGLAVSAGEHHRLTAGVRSLLAMEWRTGDVARGAAQHFAWWVGHSSVVPEQVAAEAEVLVAALYADREAGRHGSVVLLARAAAPALALSLRWGAWEQVLRLGLEAARTSGAVSDEAWFHHELGVLALVTGAEDRARTELEASVALRGALGDTSAGAARRMLALLAGAGGAAGAAGAVGRPAQGRSMGHLLWRRGGAAGGRARRRGAAAGAGVVLLAALGATAGLVAAGSSAGTPTPQRTVPGVPADAGVPEDPADLGASPSADAPSAPASGTVRGTSRPPSASSSATAASAPLPVPGGSGAPSGSAGPAAPTAGAPKPSARPTGGGTPSRPPKPSPSGTSPKPSPSGTSASPTASPSGSASPSTTTPVDPPPPPPGTSQSGTGLP